MVHLVSGDDVYTKPLQTAALLIPADVHCYRATLGCCIMNLEHGGPQTV